LSVPRIELKALCLLGNVYLISMTVAVKSRWITFIALSHSSNVYWMPAIFLALLKAWGIRWWAKATFLAIIFYSSSNLSLIN
jgi:hypothetical protein